MERQDDDGGTSSSAKLSKWDIKELRLGARDPILSEALPFLSKVDEFQKWCDLLQANDRRAAKILLLELEPGPVSIEIVTFFTDVASRTLQVHLDLKLGRSNLEQWMKNHGSKAK